MTPRCHTLPHIFAPRSHTLASCSHAAASSHALAGSRPPGKHVLIRLGRQDDGVIGGFGCLLRLLLAVVQELRICPIAVRHQLLVCALLQDASRLHMDGELAAA